MAEYKNKRLAALHELQWAEAVSRLEIEFTAAHGGGHPECLKHLSEEVRVNTLKALDFRVNRRFEFNDAEPCEGAKIWRWAALSGGISVCLTDGFVCAITEGV